MRIRYRQTSRCANRAPSSSRLGTGGSQRRRKSVKRHIDDYVFLSIVFIGTCLGILLSIESRQINETEKILQRKKQIPRVVIMSNDDASDVKPVSSLQYISKQELHNTDECQPLVEWEKTTNINCNTVHELDLVSANSELVSQGYIRQVWKVIHETGNSFALKTRINGKSFSESTLEGQANDARISDQLVTSNNVAKIYGYCAFTSIYDFSSEGTLEDHYKTLSKVDRLRAAVDVAKGLADLHDLGNKGYSAIIHNDIAVRQYIWVDDRYKLNDFNTARFIHWNPKMNNICPEENHYFLDKNRSPEEMRHEVNYIDEKIDVYSMGNIFYKLMTSERKYEGIKSEAARRLILQGDIPNVTLIDDIDRILQQAMIMCLQLNPEDRSSAKDIYSYLKIESSIIEDSL